MSAILQDAREQRLRRDYFLTAAQPIYSHMAKIHATYSKITMVIAPDGRLISDTKALPYYAQVWIAQCEEAIETCRMLSETVKL